MPTACNIDKRGRIARLIYGLILLVLAAWLAFAWALPNRAPVPWVVVGFVAVAGLFGLYEARKGWCAVRAMGIKTPL